MVRIALGSAFSLCFMATACAENAATANAQSVDSSAWAVDYEASQLRFTASQTGKEFDGAFKDFTADIVFDPDNLDDASISVSVDMKSAKTGDRQRDSALPASDWFGAKKFPIATFTSENISATGDGAYEARGDLTIRDVTLAITLPFTLSIENDAANAEGGVDILRTDFGVGQGEFESDQWVGLEVGVEFAIKATR